MPVITANEAETLLPLFKGKAGHALFRAALKLTAVDHVNDTHSKLEGMGLSGPDFAAGILDDIDIDYSIGNPERIGDFPEGPFITVSNHVYGHIDGIMLVDLVGHIRPNVKVMVNELLMKIRGLAPSFISVNPTLSEKKAATAQSINGVKQALLQIRSGEPLCLFPSGAVSDLKPREHWTISDRSWQDAAIKLIKKAHVPVIPIRFFDRNSMFYYLLGLIDYRVRLVRLFHEMYNKRGTSPRLGIGEIITPEQQDACKDLDELNSLLRSGVYDMPLPEHYLKRSELSL